MLVTRGRVAAATAGRRAAQRELQERDRPGLARLVEEDLRPGSPR